ncbi:MAG: hypothetical protein HQL76_07120 [Magnetococcales bacterium]|nr:hypothetical protein [Magnetococcales bacterium]
MNTHLWRQGTIRLGLAVLVLVVHVMALGPFLSGDRGLLGPGHAVTLPRLLDGFLWLKNNSFLDPPWFTPAFCGGLPAFPNPDNPFYSLPQALTLFMDPLKSIQVTFHLFALVGYFGFLRLLSDRFAVSTPTAVLGAVLFAFNGAFNHSMILGASAHHFLMLTPWIAWLLTRSASPRRTPGATGNRIPEAGPENLFFQAIAAGTLLSYGVWCGALSLIPSTLLFLALVHLTLRITHPVDNHRFWTPLALALLVATALSAAKWWPGIRFLDHLGAAPTPLAGLTALDTAFSLLFESLFFTPVDEQTLAGHLIDPSFPFVSFAPLVQVTFIPLAFLVATLVLWWHRRRETREKTFTPRRQVTRIVLLILLAVLPLATAVHSPLWDPFLREAPLLRAGTPLIEGWSIYPGLVLLWIFVAHDRWNWAPGHRRELALAGLLVAFAHPFMVDGQPWIRESYDPAPILSAWQRQHAADIPFHIHRLDAVIDPETRQVALPLDRDNRMVRGISTMFCNEPVLGPALQRFPYAPLVMGMVFSATEKGFNMKNPACYLAPLENQCQVGDHFRREQRDSLERFTHYRTFPFHKPQGQETAEWLGLVTLFGIMAGGVTGVWRRSQSLSPGNTWSFP